MPPAERLYLRARFPDIYFMVGQFRSSGTVADVGMLLGAEAFAVDQDTPVHEFTTARRGVAQPLRLLRYNTVHELVHVQQVWKGKETLLERAILEGTAELGASIVVPDAPVPVNHEFATRRQQEIWQRFTRDMDSTDTSQWLANNQRATPDWPAAMAYNVGDHIARGFYESAEDKRAALQELFELKQPHGILRRSGYPPGR
jgi:hypothetical protein